MPGMDFCRRVSLLVHTDSENVRYPVPAVHRYRDSIEFSQFIIPKY